MLDSIKSIASINQPSLSSSYDTLNVNQSPSCAARFDISYAVALSDNLFQVVKSAVVESFRKEKAVERGNLQYEGIWK